MLSSNITKLSEYTAYLLRGLWEGKESREEAVFMTANQVAYIKAKEDARANRAREAENYRHDYATERENETHNRNVEGETYRANKQQEALSGIANSIKAYEARTGAQNAETNAVNAATRQREANIKSGELSLAERKYYTDVLNKGIDQDIQREGNYINAFTNLVGSVVKVAGFLA